MNKRSLLSVAASVMLAGASHLVEAAQLTPNPNPPGSTINDPSAVNNDNPYYNGGTITIDSRSTQTNSVGGAPNNSDPTTFAGGMLNNAGTLIKYGSLNNQNGATLTNAGMLNNTGSINKSCRGVYPDCRPNNQPLDFSLRPYRQKTSP